MMKRLLLFIGLVLAATSLAGATMMTLTGAGRPLAAAVATVTLTAHPTSSSNASSYTYSAVAAGNTGDNLIVGVYGSRASGTPASITSVTVNGVTATPIAGASQTNDAFIVALYFAPAAGGASISIVVVFGQGQDQAAISVWQALNLTGGGAATATLVSTASPLTGSLNVPAGGIAVGMAETQASSSFTWSGLSEDFDQVVESQTCSGASVALSAGNASLTVTATQASSHFPALVAASFR